MPWLAARSITRSAWAKYASLGVEKSPAVVNGASPAAFRGALLANLCSIRLTMSVFTPRVCRSARYSVASVVFSCAINDHAASPCTRNGLPSAVTSELPSPATPSGNRRAGGGASTMGGEPPSMGGKSPSPGGEPPSRGGEPPSRGGEPPSPGREPSSPGGEPPSPGGERGGEPPSPESEPPLPGAEHAVRASIARAAPHFGAPDRSRNIVGSLRRRRRPIQPVASARMIARSELTLPDWRRNKPTYPRSALK